MSGRQVQKYETGANSLTIARLHQFAKVLNQPETAFFETTSMTPEDSVKVLYLVQNWERIASAEVRQEISTLIRALAQSANKKDLKPP